MPPLASLSSGRSASAVASGLACSGRRRLLRVAGAAFSPLPLLGPILAFGLLLAPLGCFSCHLSPVVAAGFERRAQLHCRLGRGVRSGHDAGSGGGRWAQGGAAARCRAGVPRPAAGLRRPTGSSVTAGSRRACAPLAGRWPGRGRAAVPRLPPFRVSGVIPARRFKDSLGVRRGGRECRKVPPLPDRFAEGRGARRTRQLRVATGPGYSAGRRKRRARALLRPRGGGGDRAGPGRRGAGAGLSISSQNLLFSV